MKQILFTSFFILSIVFLGHAQDKIITVENDTILCKVIRNNNHFISFMMNQQGIQTQGKLDRLKLKQIIISTQEPYSKATIPVFNRWRVGLSGGLGYLVADIKAGKTAAMTLGLTQDQADEYYNQLTLGWQAGANIHYLLQPDFGVGINYRFFNSNADLWVTMDPHDGVNLYYGKMVESMYVNYVGASVFALQPLTANKKLLINSAISAGLTMYRDEASMLESKYLLTGKAFGLTFDLGLEYFIVKNISVGADLNLFASKIRKMTLGDGNTSTTMKLSKENYENISSLDLSAGLKIYF